MIRFLLLATLFLTGCATPSYHPTAFTDMRQWWQPQSTFLNPSTEGALYVEIDHVEGYPPTDHAVSELETFLQKHTRLKGGVIITQDPPFPAKKARRLSKEMLAIATLDGPPKSKAPDQQNAYLHILYINRDISDIPPQNLIQTFASWMPGHKDNTLGIVNYYRGPNQIYVDGKRALNRFFQHTESTIIQHEAGHTLGLPHVEETETLMGPTVEINNWRFLLGLFCGPPKPLNYSLGQESRDTLQASYQEADPGQTFFAGPALVRRANGYCVAHLPGFVSVRFQQPDQIDGWEMLEEAKQFVQKNFWTELNGWDADPVYHTPEQANEILDQAMQDPHPAVSKIIESYRQDIFDYLTTSAKSK